jgi:hypothetical protein
MAERREPVRDKEYEKYLDQYKVEPFSHTPFPPSFLKSSSPLLRSLVTSALKMETAYFSETLSST